MLSWLPENISSFGGDIDHIYKLVYYVVGVWFLLAEGLFFYFILRFRRKEGQKAAYLPGKTFKSLLWVLLPCVLVLICDIVIDHASAKVWDQVKIELPEADLEIGIGGKQGVWTFMHPGADGVLGTVDDIRKLNQLRIPVDKTIVFHLTAKDVLHSFFIPKARLKQDAVPGRSIQGWFKITKTGKFQIVCAELCGIGHSVMGAKLFVHTSEDYAAWVQKQEAKRQARLGG